MQPSASKTNLLLNCQYPFDPNLELPPDEGSKAARYGSAFHQVMAGLDFKKSKGKPAKPPNYQKLVDDACERWGLRSEGAELAGHVWGSYVVLKHWVEGRNPWGIDFTTPRLLHGGGLGAGLAAEKSYAINPSARSAREVKLDLKFHQYEGLESHEIGGTADLMTTSATSGTPLVEDHKTGSGENFSSPEENDQIKTLALIPSDPGPVLVAVLHADRRGLPMIYPGEVSAAVRAGHAQKVAKALSRVGDGSLRPGPWCQYCRARPICPTQYASIVPQAVALMEASGLSVVPPNDLTTTAEQVGRFHQLKSLILRAIDQGDKEARAFIEEHPELVVTRPDGRHLEFVEREVERISKKAILEALGKKQGERELTRLRELGCLTTKVEKHLLALDDK